MIQVQTKNNLTMNEIILKLEKEVNECNKIYIKKSEELINYKKCNILLQTNNYQMAKLDNLSNKFALVTINISDDECMCLREKNLTFNIYLHNDKIISTGTKQGLIPNYIFEDIGNLKESDFRKKYEHCYKTQKIYYNPTTVLDNGYWLIDLQIPFEWM